MKRSQLQAAYPKGPTLTRPDNNTAPRIAELRKKIIAAKGKASRARATAAELQYKAAKYEAQVHRDQEEIRSMGGVVRS